MEWQQVSPGRLELVDAPLGRIQQASAIELCGVYLIVGNFDPTDLNGYLADREPNQGQGTPFSLPAPLPLVAPLGSFFFRIAADGTTMAPLIYALTPNGWSTQ